MNTPVSAVDILPYEPAHQAAFRDLNHEWITRYFVLEDLDRRMLDDPQGYILDRGGYIFMARHNGQLVGTCALVYEHEGVYELAKMAVTPAAQGLGIGYLLGQAVINKAREIGAREIELLSNRKLAPALALYRKLGFAEAPLLPSEYQRSDIRMVLAL
ncbi:GNAT family N-acetyltransferase [Hymenobacter busanensis]|uniref:GNAT family N-acetyltransferase n=1 Tax=Hymenobacter busanensis TaxID=2607656 RepID=A0A7L4ZYZ1_9BACT|nr:GNAT family N-acetyltransferase [Hymenobacter busanensis]KAA9333048.1 GNAT family N-acetyltransferase [Hymenobacter busanensis]QHJ08277.1 GNAT family N-acetyltransferase [Hymenobacter busanensis]